MSSALKLGSVVHDSCEQCLVVISTSPSSGCFLQKIAVLLSSAFMFGCLVQETCEQRLLVKFPMP